MCTHICVPVYVYTYMSVRCPTGLVVGAVLDGDNVGEHVSAVVYAARALPMDEQLPSSTGPTKGIE